MFWTSKLSETSLTLCIVNIGHTSLHCTHSPFCCVGGPYPQVHIWTQPVFFAWLSLDLMIHNRVLRENQRELFHSTKADIFGCEKESASHAESSPQRSAARMTDDRWPKTKSDLASGTCRLSMDYVSAISSRGRKLIIFQRSQLHQHLKRSERSSPPPAGTGTHTSYMT